MSIFDIFTRSDRRKQTIKKVVRKSNPGVTKNWYNDKYHSLVMQRNVLFLIAIISLVIIFFSIVIIGYIKNTKSIEPFVIEIESKTGVPTVVEPLSMRVYSAQEAVKRYFVMKYIKAREEYLPSTYEYSYNTVVRVLSTPEVYLTDFRPKVNSGNPMSPINLYGSSSKLTVRPKSIIFPRDSSAQVRITINVDGPKPQEFNKIVYMEFNFSNISMNEVERLINPLGFTVSLYRIEDEAL